MQKIGKSRVIDPDAPKICVCEKYMLPSQQIEAQVKWGIEFGKPSDLKYEFGQPLVCDVNLPDLV